LKLRNNLARLVAAGAVAGGGIAGVAAAMSGTATAGAAANLITADTLDLAALSGQPLPTAAQSLTLTSVSLGATNTTNIGSQSTGVGAGKAKFSPLVVTIHPGLEEPALLQILASGRALNATLYVIVGSAPSGSQPNYLEYQLTTVGLVGDSLAQGGSNPANGLVTLTFQYGSETVIANVTNASGNAQQTSGCWNIVTNAGCLPTSF
jgi:type VI protein secretion system component Hcp